MRVSKVYEMPVDAYGDVRTLVRGLPYQCPDDWEDVLDSLDEDSNLYLVKEPDNPKDKLAIAAYLDDRRVGYVAASDNAKIWLYLTEEKMPCKFIERFDASFKISFENPRFLFEDMPFEEIYRDKDGVTDEPFPEFDIPFLTNPKDNNYEWLDDRTYIMDLEKFIPDFRRKLAARMIILVGRKNSKGEYCYYLPYANNIIADIHNEEITDVIDEYGFVIALPDVPMKTERGGIIMDLHVTYLTGIIFWTFNSMHNSEFVFHLREDMVKRPKINKKNPVKKMKQKESSQVASAMKTEDGESYEISDDPEGGKHVSMGIIVPNEDDEEFDFCSYECSISDKEQIELIKSYMRRYEKGKESRPFLMIGRPLMGTDLDIFYSLDGEIIFNFIFDEKIKDWIKEAGFVLGKVISYRADSYSPGKLNVTLSVSKRKAGEALFKQASEDAMDYIEEVVQSTADYQVERKVVDAVNEYLAGKTSSPYKIVLVPWKGIVVYINLDGEQIGIVRDYEIQKIAEDNKGIFGFITNFEYDDDENNVEFTIRVSRSIPKLNIDQDPETSKNSINDFFPIFGITLGETTWKQAEDMGNVVKIWKEGPSRYMDIGKTTFWDHGGKGVFTSINWHYFDDDFPSIWKSKGFSWDNSYEDWLEAFKKLGFTIEITEEPSLEEYYGHDTLSAEFWATSSDGMLSFNLDFDYGEDGYLTSSPKTLYSIGVTYKGLLKREGGTSSAIKEFFPIFGITLGETTWKQAEDLGNKVKIYEEGPSRLIHIEDLLFWDHEGMGIFTSLYWSHSYNNTDFPPLWKSKGFSWDNSYDEWIDVFNKLGYNITVKQQPSQKEFCGRNTLSARFKALSSDGSLSFDLIFDYGDNGYLTSSPKTLNVVIVDCEF